MASSASRSSNEDQEKTMPMKPPKLGTVTVEFTVLRHEPGDEDYADEIHVDLRQARILKGKKYKGAGTLVAFTIEGAYGYPEVEVLRDPVCKVSVRPFRAYIQKG